VLEPDTTQARWPNAGEKEKPIHPSDPYARRTETFPRLTPDQVERVVAFGLVQKLSRGTVLFECGDRRVDFFLVLDGFVEVYKSRGAVDHVMYTHGQHQFTGELNIFNDRAVIVGARMGADGSVARLSPPQFRRLRAAEPDIANVVMQAFILRRDGLILHGHTPVQIIAPQRSAESLQLQQFLTRNRHPYLLAHPEVDPEAATQLAELDFTIEDTPVVLCGGGRALLCPTTRELGDILGIAESLGPGHVPDVVVVGAGPAGLAAAVYSASEGLDTVVVEDHAPGGQASTSSRIENYLGFPLGISGADLAHYAQVQAQKFGAHIVVPRRVVRVNTDSRPYAIELDDGTVIRGHTVVLATGARYRSLPLPDVARYEGAGVHYAATAIEAALCDGEEAIVVGGGNSAGQAAVFLSRHAAHVHVVVRGTGLASTMSEYLVSRIKAAPERITVHPDTEITALIGDRHVDAVTWRNRLTGESQTHSIPNVFLMLGAEPNTEWLNGAVALDDKGFVLTGDSVEPEEPGSAHTLAQPLATSCPGIFAVGDVRCGSLKRVASAVGDGAVVVASIHQALADMRGPNKHCRPSRLGKVWPDASAPKRIEKGHTDKMLSSPQQRAVT
jgi:thioredoxin reductase (NADPH)